MTSREQQYLLDVLLEAENAVSFVRGLTFERFADDVLVRYAVLHSLTILGEAAGRISRTAGTDLPWQKMKDLRNLIVHDYQGVNLPLIWDIVTVELPKVIAALDPLFPERPKP